MAITGLIGCKTLATPDPEISPSESSTSTECNTTSFVAANNDSKSFTPLLDGKEADPSRARVVLEAESGTQVIFKETKEAGGCWDKVEIKYMEVWIDQGYLNCGDRVEGSTCNVK